MAKVFMSKPGEVEGVTRKGEPLPRPYVILDDGTVMKYKNWLDAKNPS